MSTVFYNGIALAITRTLVNRRQVRMDGPSYLWTDWTLTVQAVYNPGATSYAPALGQRGGVVPGPGNNPARTDSAIRHLLAQPRGKLVYTSGGYNALGLPDVFGDGWGNASGSLVILDTPPSDNPDDPDVTGDPGLNRYLTDCDNGPKPFHLDVRKMDGTKTWFVEWGVKVALNECYDWYRNPTPLLSHLWRMRLDMDRDGFTKRVVSGHMVFRSDRLLDLGAAGNVRADSYAEALAHNIPPNFERRGLVRELSEDGCRLDYSFVDQEVPTTITKRNVTRIEAHVRVGQSTGSPETALLGVLRRGGRMGMALGAAEGALGLIGRLTLTLVIRVWGNRFANKANLLATAVRVAMIKLPPAPGADAAGMSADVTIDLMGRYVDLELNYVLGPLGKMLAVGGQEIKDVFPEFFNSDCEDVATAQDTPGRHPVPDRRSYGSYVGELIPPSLAGACQNPGFPPVHRAGVAGPLPNPGS